MKKIAILGMAAATLLAGCGGGTNAADDTGMLDTQFVGTWGADCASPYMKLTPSTIEVYADNATNTLTSADSDGSSLQLAYDSANGPVTENYAIEGETLRLVSGNYNGMEADWTKQPMQKCP